MSLMKAENREAFKADERAYLDEWPMTEEQKQAVLARDYNGLIALGGNIYFLAKIFATDGKSFQQAAARDDGRERGRTIAQMMVGGGRTSEGQPLQREAGLDGADHRRHRHVSRAGHRRRDRYRQDRRAYWAPLFKGFEFSKMEAPNKPDVVILVYNDHATAFSPGLHPDLRDRLRRRVRAGRRRLGRAAGAGGEGRMPELAWHIAQQRDRAGVRPHHRQPDGCRPRPHRAAVADVRPADGVARAG